MKSIFFLLAMAIVTISFAQSEDEAVKQVINKAYIGGIHNGGPIDDIRKGFHPSFIMFIKNNNDVKSTTIEEWIGNIEKSRQAGTKQGDPAVARFVTVSVNGNAAAAVLDLYRGDKKVFTDNLLLYKFDEGWRIVGKSFFRHP